MSATGQYHRAVGSSAFDVVVVGAGAAGCVVAARLAEATSRSILLLEAGPDLRADPPALVRDGWHMTREYDWGDTAEPGGAEAGSAVRRVRLVGGTSSVTRFAMRGSPGDYDEWEALGNPDWGWDSVLPAFTALESDLEFGDAPWHGSDGPITVTRYPDLARTEAHEAMADAIERSGFPSVADHNRPGAVGVGRIPMSSRDGIRVAAASAYLPAGSEPASLTVRSESPVAAVLLDGARARGVRLADGSEIAAEVVVISAGVFGSPPLLMRSGIGPGDELRALGIDVVLHLPGVGANLADHPGSDLDTGYRGPARSEPLLHTASTFHSSMASTEGPPDLMFWVTDPAPPDDPQATIDVVLLKPYSRGSVRLRSADPADPPLIRLPNLDDERDVDRLVEGYRRAREVATELPPDLFSPDVEHDVRDTDALRRMVRGNAYSVPHFTGTCAMGPAPDAGAVVDAAGRVHGSAGLFLVDASIMPTEPSGFTHLPTLMLAERLSASIAAKLI